MPEVAFGSQCLTFEVRQGDSFIEAVPSKDVPPIDDRIFQNRLNHAGFENLIKTGRPLVIVNDAYRATPTGFVLSQIKKFYPEFEADYIIACGNHPRPKEDGLAEIFNGFSLHPKSSIYYHDSRAMDEMKKIGELQAKPVYLNKAVFDYPLLISIGSVEPHYFAGFTGGRKSLIPGLADIETNRRNHALAVSMNAQPMRLHGNPVAENLELLINLTHGLNLFSIQIVTGHDDKIVDICCGNLKDSFGDAVVTSEKVYSFKVKNKFDLVIAEVKPPLDRNLYQLQKSIENNASVVSDGGTIIAVSKCSEGIGNDEFYRLASRLKDKETVLMQAQKDNPPLGIHKLSRIIEISRRIKIKALTRLNQETLKQVFWQPAVSIDEEIQKLRKKKENLNILLVRDAGQLVAKLNL